MKRLMTLASVLLVVLVLLMSTGASLAAPPNTIAAQADVEDPGLVIVKVDRDGPAAEAGVTRGDILLAVDDEPVNAVKDLRQILRGLEPGDKVELTVLHGDDQRTLTAVLAEGDGVAYLGLVPYGDAFELVSTPSMVESLTAGAVITQVVEDSPAAKAGLQTGDVITAVDDQALDADSDLAAIIGAYEPGEWITLQVLRSDTDEISEVTVILGENPDEPGSAFLGVGYFGGYQGAFGPGRMPRFLEDLDPEEFEDLLPMPGMPDEHEGFFRTFPFPFSDEEFSAELVQGAVVRRVVDDSPAAEAGLQPGDVITAIDGEPVESPDDLPDIIASLEPGETLVLTVERPDEDESMELEAVLGEDEDGEAYLGVTIGGFFMHMQGLPFGQNQEQRRGFGMPWLERLLPGDELPFELPFDLDQLELPFRFRFEDITPPNVAPQLQGESI